MDRQIYHGDLNPSDIAQALLAEFNQGNLRAQILGQADNLAVQIGTRLGAASGGKTALAVTIQKVSDGSDDSNWTTRMARHRNFSRLDSRCRSAKSL